MKIMKIMKILGNSYRPINRLWEAKKAITIFGLVIIIFSYPNRLPGQNMVNQ
jgi:hypothetical protein